MSNQDNTTILKVLGGSFRAEVNQGAGEIGIYFRTQTGEEIDICNIVLKDKFGNYLENSSNKVAATASVYVFSDPYNEDYTHKVNISINEIIKAVTTVV